ncbi:MAG: hydrogenase [bacterium]|nr:hydrogenase [bacterium]
MVNKEDIKKEAKKVLTEGTVKYLVGYKRGANGLMPVPAFIEDPAEVENLIWDGTCIHNLTRFLVDEKRRKARQKEPDNRPIAVIAKGCDSRAVVVLLQEKFIRREDVYIIGVSCENAGVVDIKKVERKFKEKKPVKVKFQDDNHFLIVTRFGNIKVPVEEVLAQRCLECRANYPVIYDVLLGEKVKKKPGNYFKSLEPVEALAPEARWSMWEEQMDRCIRCYACRSVCPMCYCEECVVDSANYAVTPETTAEEKAQTIKWIEKSPALSENLFYHMIRALHLAGRCIDCGACKRVCPMDIPLNLLNKKMEKEALQCFDYQSGFDADGPSLVSSFRDDDPQDFIA